MIRRIRQWLEVRRIKRAFLAAQGRPAIWLPSGTHDHEPYGATLDWSPADEIAEALEAEPDELHEARAEFDAAAAELKPMLDDFHRRMARAFRDFDAGLLAPMHTTARWHAAGRDCCQVCAEHNARTFGAIGERFGIRSFRIDTPTAAYKIYNPHGDRYAVAA